MAFPLSDAELAGVVAELGPRLRGEVTGKVWQPDAHTLILEIGRERLCVSAHPKLARLHLVPRTPATGEPTAFAMLVRKHLGGRRLHELRATPGDRLVRMELGGDVLIAELTAPHADVVLVDESGNVLGSLRNRTPGVYAPPPPPPSAWARWLGRKDFGDSPGVAERVAAAAEVATRELRTRELREAIGAKWRRELERAERRRRAIDDDLARITDAEGDRKRADLLLAHAFSLPARGASSVVVPDDFVDGSPLTIELDPALDIRQNAAQLYRRHQRLAQGRARAEARRTAAIAEADEITQRLHRLPHLSLDELESLAPAPRPKRRRAVQEERLPYHVFVSQSGDEIWVGRSAKDNDALTFRHARGNDLWLHCRDAAGSHVVIPQRGKATGEATFLDAATLAARHSSLRKEAQVDVTYTHVKSLRKAKGIAGRVFVSEGKTVRVRMDAARMERLNASRAGNAD
jgi:predicted ribosome quality control (RQC) complex YloA/Tae2 family protein